MYFKLSIIWLSLSISIPTLPATWHGKNIKKLAVIKDPVVDLLQDKKNVFCLAAAPAHGASLRRHQALFNEVVECLQEIGDFAQIMCNNLQPNKPYWVEREQLLYLTDIKDTQLIPAPLTEPSTAQQATTLVITLPWNQFSVATRFVRAPEHDTPQAYGIKFLNTKNNSTAHATVPRAHCRLEAEQTDAQMRTTFIALLNQLLEYSAHHHAVIAYVNGGSSFVQPYHEVFTLHDAAWHRADFTCEKPYSGYSCSELVLRMAQTSGIPYFFKNSQALEKHGDEIAAQETLKVGDLLWMPGHVAIISDLKRNEIIEVAGYHTGFGCVHKLPLKKFFKGIKTFSQLRAAHAAKKSVTRLKKDGSVARVYKEFKLIKLPLAPMRLG